MRSTSADPWKYHTGDASPFWKKFREALVINPESTSGNPITTEFRNPPPGSRPEKYALPPSKASDPAQNAYFQRDYRRRYPRLDVITQQDLSALLLAQPEALGNLPAPSNAPAKAAETTTDVTTVPSPAPSLSSLYLAPAASGSATSPVATSSAYTAGKLPPGPVSAIKLSWAPSSDKVERDPYSYFPMDNFSSTVTHQIGSYGHETERTGITNNVK